MIDPGATCWTLIRGAAKGSETDRESFARFYLPVVRSYLEARWCRSPLISEVEDAAQDVFFECLKEDGVLMKANPDAAGSGFRGYLRSIVRNVALRIEWKRARRREHQAASDFDLGNINVNEESLGEAYDRAWATALVKLALARLKEASPGAGEQAARQVELLRLQFQEGLKIPEIARRWSEDVGRLYQQSYKACDGFLVKLKEVVAFHQPENQLTLERECARLLECFR